MDYLKLIKSTCVLINYMVNMKIIIYFCRWNEYTTTMSRNSTISTSSFIQVLQVVKT